MKFWRWLFCGFIFAETVLGQDVQWRADRLQRQVFSYPEVCQAMGVKDAPLISARGSQLDCMGTMVSLRDFCLQQTSPKPFLRAVAWDKRHEVTCEYGMRGILELSCTKVDCHHPVAQCQALRTVYARQLDLVHSGVWAAGEIPQSSPFAAEEKIGKADKTPGPEKASGEEKTVAQDLNIFAFPRLKLECIYEARASLWEHDDGRF
ncbi:MAG: hypothetical protein J6Y94_08465 [Bacteriovoracaceae bacterium]|nr:hypothetical protein [Bacteriovoracaceae bacterium]